MHLGGSPRCSVLATLLVTFAVLEVTFDGLVDMMVAHDLRMAERERVLVDAGHADEGARF